MLHQNSFLCFMFLNQYSSAFRDYANIGLESADQTLLAIHFTTWAVPRTERKLQKFGPGPHTPQASLVPRPLRVSNNWDGAEKEVEDKKA